MISSKNWYQGTKIRSLIDYRRELSRFFSLRLGEMELFVFPFQRYPSIKFGIWSKPVPDRFASQSDAPWAPFLMRREPL
jgi:hypothetical protein